MKRLRYEIQKQELFISKFPFAKVLQPKYLKDSYNPVVDIFKKEIREYLKDCKFKDIEDINVEIYAIVKRLERSYPLCFDTTGFYTKNMLAYLYEEGRLTYEGSRLYPAELEAKELLRHEDIIRRYEEKELNELRKKEEAKEAKEHYNRLRETTREFITIGDVFNSKAELYESFKEQFPLKVNNKIRDEIIASICKVEYLATREGCIKRWVVTEIFIEDVVKRYTLYPNRS